MQNAPSVNVSPPSDTELSDTPEALYGTADRANITSVLPAVRFIVVEQLTVVDVPCADALTHWLTRVWSDEGGVVGVDKIVTEYMLDAPTLTVVSVTFAMTVNVPAAVGTPLNIPMALIVTPGGAPLTLHE